MCLFSTTPTRSHTHSVVDPPPHRSNFSAHPHNPSVVRLPRGSTHSYRQYRTSTGSLSEAPRAVEYHRSSRPREIEYVEEQPRRSVSRRRSVVRDVEVRGSRGSFVDERKRSVSRVRY
ncbi:hypothetical protein BDV95DRAFT_561217 [Massariosphaeria phaeospora]|uniref:Uncharacterized protein n=1 Tax=Massariosphaeria phaeospora TaxID=100035 RepID=A0A7C8MLZ5_9PLEO|nr:hypothetical protein BDV95DRAFT_561217 [Massariosphaeria phaeospora]